MYVASCSLHVAWAIVNINFYGENDYRAERVIAMASRKFVYPSVCDVEILW